MKSLKILFSSSTLKKKSAVRCETGKSHTRGGPVTSEREAVCAQGGSVLLLGDPGRLLATGLRAGPPAWTAPEVPAAPKPPAGQVGREQVWQGGNEICNSSVSDSNL